MELVEISLEDLNEFPDNPRTNEVGRIADSLLEHGQYRPLTVNKKGNVILTGNHTYQAMKKLGWENALCTFVDVDEDQARKIVLVDNRLNDLAEYDSENLSKMLQELVETNDFFGTGFHSNEVDDLLKDLSPETDMSKVETDLPPKQKGTEIDGEVFQQIVLYFNEDEFQQYKTHIQAIAEHYKCNLTQACIKSVEFAFEELGLTS